LSSQPFNEVVRPWNRQQSTLAFHRYSTGMASDRQRALASQVPGHFFRRVGFFVDEHFLTPDYCEKIRTASTLTEGRPGGIRRRKGDVVVDASKRQVAQSELPIEMRRFVLSRLLSLKPAIEKHFGTALEGVEDPLLLKYRIGDFYKAHRDRSDDPRTAEFFRQRRVSVVAFINTQTQDEEADSYCGGALVFYGVVKEPKWEDCAFSMTGHAGTLVAFRADTLHEVQPVTAGTRLTIATWYYH
jgi:SM-20-related protein